MVRKGLRPAEIETAYVQDSDRFVVSLIVGYGQADGVTSPAAALAAALDLTRDAGSAGTQWYVFDRQSQRMHRLEQSDVVAPGAV